MSKTVRQRLLGQVHIEKKRLRLGEDAYRDLLESLTGQRSAKDCTEPELERVLTWIRTKFPVKQELPNGRSLSPTSRNRTEKTPADKMVALWIECYRAGAVQDRSHEALVSFVQGILGRKIVVLPGVDPLAALSPQKCKAVIEALKAMLERNQDD